eukprot:gene915-biopygen3471
MKEHGRTLPTTPPSAALVRPPPSSAIMGGGGGARHAVDLLREQPLDVVVLVLEPRVVSPPRQHLAYAEARAAADAVALALVAPAKGAAASRARRRGGTRADRRAPGLIPDHGVVQVMLPARGSGVL